MRLGVPSRLRRTRLGVPVRVGITLPGFDRRGRAPRKTYSARRLHSLSNGRSRCLRRHRRGGRGRSRYHTTCGVLSCWIMPSSESSERLRYTVPRLMRPSWRRTSTNTSSAVGWPLCRARTASRTSRRCRVLRRCTAIGASLPSWLLALLRDVRCAGLPCCAHTAARNAARRVRAAAATRLACGRGSAGERGRNYKTDVPAQHPRTSLYMSILLTFTRAPQGAH